MGFYTNVVRDTRVVGGELTLVASGLRSRGCRRPVSLKVVGRRKDVDRGSSSSELSTASDDFPTSDRSGTSSSSDYILNSAVQSGPGALHTSLGTSSRAASRAACSSAFRVSLNSFFSFSEMYGQLDTRQLVRGGHVPIHCFLGKTSISSRAFSLLYSPTSAQKLFSKRSQSWKFAVGSQLRSRKFNRHYRGVEQ